MMKSRIAVACLVVGLIGTGACEFAGIPGSESDSVDPVDEPDAGRTPIPTDDTDGDGVTDDVDNCIETPNVLQRDEDLDEVGDLCDNCPAHPNTDQANVGEIDVQLAADGVGDACDPRPDKAGDTIAHFDGFLDPLGADWVFAPGSESWNAGDGGLHRTDTSGVGTIYWTGKMLTDSVIETSVTVDALGLGGDVMRGVGAIAHYMPREQDGYACIESLNTQSLVNEVAMYTFTPPQVYIIGAGTTASPPLAIGQNIDLRLAATGSASTIECRRKNNGAEVTRSQSVFNNSTGYVGLHTYRAAVTYHHIVVYELGGPL